MISMAELLILAVIVVIIVTGAVIVNRRIGTPNQRPAMMPRPRPTPQELDHALQTLIQQNRKIQAIKLLRDHTGMGLKEAKQAVDGLAVGHPITYPPSLGQRPTPPATTPPATAHSDLATRVRQLKETGRTEQAIFLVRGETGMDEASATLFVNSL
ncbi:ribosomal protein L7/L12 [Nonomuraea sp. LPB2021202275-12-8]|uniref:ribosomal protein L7/L12 n=1 Tax=Nonomuraea sp. LPB2021202275-12-8 TaxID=3120159 RepID=UPI00300C8174